MGEPYGSLDHAEKPVRACMEAGELMSRASLYMIEQYG